MTTDELIDAIIKWGDAKGINNPTTQANKVAEEWGETMQEFNHERFGDEFVDGIGDTLVTLIIFANINGLDIRDCLEKAYNEIKGREGVNHNGNFIRDKYGTDTE